MIFYDLWIMEKKEWGKRVFRECERICTHFNSIPAYFPYHRKQSSFWCYQQFNVIMIVCVVVVFLCVYRKMLDSSVQSTCRQFVDWSILCLHEIYLYISIYLEWCLYIERFCWLFVFFIFFSLWQCLQSRSMYDMHDMTISIHIYFFLHISK